MASKSIRLAKLTAEFTEQYLQLVNDPVVRQTTDPCQEAGPFSKEDVTRWLTGISTKSGRKDYAIILIDEAGGPQFVGEVVINEIKDKSANIRIAILPQFFDQGIGSHAMRLAIDRSFTELGLAELKLSVFDINPRGIRVYEKLGFKRSYIEEEDGISEIHMSLSKKSWLDGIAQ